MQYQIEDRVFINEAGNQVKYKRLVVTGFLAGEVQTLELPISKDQAVIYNAMKADSPEVNVRKASKDEVPEVTHKADKLDLFDED